jgi:hypothetical protein
LMICSSIICLRFFRLFTNGYVTLKTKNSQNKFESFLKITFM